DRRPPPSSRRWPAPLPAPCRRARRRRDVGTLSASAGRATFASGERGTSSFSVAWVTSGDRVSSFHSTSASRGGLGADPSTHQAFKALAGVAPEGTYAHG